jgi:RHS repeat-associated protein
MTTKETKNINSALINKYLYGRNLVHMKTYEQRGHDSNKGDIFAYDGIYRLTGVKFNSPEPANPASEQFERQKSITFDKLSNILSIDETGNGQTQTITTDIPADSTYSKLNQYERFDQWGLSYDLNGNLTQKSTQHNIYDYKNRIVRATDVDSTVKFKYDPLGRRIQKEVTIGSQIKTTNFYYSGHQVIEERDGSDQVTRQLIYGNGIDEVIRVDKYTGTTSTPYYFHRNAIGSITAVTDANGNIIERVYYDIYGMPTFKDASGNVIPKSSIGNNILFQGREYDPELNLYYFRARYYDPIMGRFLQTDPMGYADSMNLYQAFNMNPYNFADPWGLTKIFINIERFRLSSDSIIGRYSIELSDMFKNIHDFLRNFADAFRLYQRAMQINANRYYTLELLWNRNQRNISSIPIGTYNVDTSWSGHFHMNLPYLQDVPGNRNYDIGGNFQPIRIHSGNHPGQIQGCILFGTTFNAQQDENWVGLSRVRVVELMNFINDVKNYDRNRGENTEIFAVITLNLPELFKNFIDRIKAGRRDYNILSFLGILSDMANNNAEVLRNLENFANKAFGPFIPRGHRIVFRTIDNWVIERRIN